MVDADSPYVTRPDIINGLRELGVSPGMRIEVHSSLSRFGRVEGGAPTVIAALMDAVSPEGAVVMSAYPVTKLLPLTDDDRALGITCKVRVFPEDSGEASGMGVIADAFRAMPGVVVGQGVHRVAAWGNGAREYARAGYGPLIAGGGKAVLLGVDIHRLSSMHAAENDMPQELHDRFRARPEALRRYPPDRWYVETAPPNREPGWSRIQDEARRRGMIRERTIGSARCMFFRLSDVVGLYRDALLSDPFGLFGLIRNEGRG